MDYDSSVTASVRPVFEQAKQRWEAILTADIPDVPSGPWGSPVDDIRISAAAVPIDGPGKALGYADMRYRRDTGFRLPITAALTIDIDDTQSPGLLDIITHELGHTLGIGTIWNSVAGLVSDYGGANPIYSGTNALAEYRAYAGNPGLTSIPVENTGNPGTRDVHWRDLNFGRELMTGFYNTGLVNPLSRMSAASLIDLGYPGVNPDAADLYDLPGGNAVPRIASLMPSALGSVVGGTLTLTAGGVSDVTGGVTGVRFYRESNGIPGLQASGNVAVLDTPVGADTAGPAWEATLDLTGLAAGSYTYYAQVRDAHGAVSTVVQTPHTVGPPPTPAAPTLDTASDSGASSTDGITSDNTPTLRGTGLAGSTVHVFADGIEIGQTTADAAATWTFTPATPLGDGVRHITVTLETGGGASASSPAVAVTIDTLAPQVTASSLVYLTMLGATFTVSEDVIASLSAGDVTFTNTTTGVAYAATLATVSGTSATFGFAGTPPRGDYVATLGRLGVNDAAGNLLAADGTLTFFVLPGDTDRSRTVDFADLLALAQHYGGPGNYAGGDLDYTGTVDFADLLILAQNYGTTLFSAPLASAAAAPTSAGRKRSTATTIVR